MKGVVLILGEERFLARQALEETLARHRELEVTRFDGAAVACAQVLDEVRTPTLLAGPRAVVVENAGPLLEGDSLAALLAYAHEPRSGSLLVLQAAKLDGRRKAGKELKAAAETVLCQPPGPRAYVQWIGEHAREAHGLMMGRPAAEAVRERIGEDLGLIDAALRRLKEQIAPRTRLEVTDVAASTEDHRSPILFEAGTALESGDLAGALRAVGAAFDEGVRIRQSVVTGAPGIALILMGQLHGAYVRVIRFHMLGGDAAAAKQAGVNPNAARFFAERARRHSLDRLVARHRHFLDAELRLKRDGQNPRQVLERLLVDLLL